jgi:hypothetical protein
LERSFNSPPPLCDLENFRTLELNLHAFISQKRSLYFDPSGHVSARFAIFEHAPPRNVVLTFTLEFFVGRREPFPVFDGFGWAGGFCVSSCGQVMAQFIDRSGLPCGNGGNRLCHVFNRWNEQGFGIHPGRFFWLEHVK